VSAVERILQNTPGSISQQWYEGGAAVDPGTVTVGITRADGTVLVTAGTGTTGTGTGSRLFNLTTTHTALLDRLTVTWTSSAKGTLVSYLEVVGGFLFTLDELAGEISSTETYTAAEMAEARTYAETKLEHKCGQAFVPRYERQTLYGYGTRSLALKWPNIRTVRSASSLYLGTTTTLTGTDLTNLTIDSYGAVHGYYWMSGYPWTIEYEHGLSHPSPDASEAALVLAKHKLVKGPIDERATQRSSEFGPVNLATPGMFGAWSGIPVVDQFVQDNDLTVGVA
jgi:hypothetical protein